VGVHLNFEKSNTGKIPFTDILAQTLAPRFQQQFPGDATLADRSNKQKQEEEEEGGPPIETTLKCQGDMWLEECKAGKIRTFRNLSKALCNLFCQKQTSCKAYIFDQSGNCGLLPDDPEGTTQTHGISGPVVKLRKPSQLRTGRNKKPMRTNEDCSEFHFEKCNKDINIHDVKFSNVYRPEDCLNMCNKGLLLKNCRSWAWSYEEGSEGGSNCWNSVSNQSELIRLGCIKFYGRVGQRSGEMEEVDGAEKYDSCITGGDSYWKCRKGDCTLWPQYGDVIKSERPHIQESEWHCKQLCYGITGCTYYKWSSYTKQCDLHYASEVPVPPNSKCYSLAAIADIGKAMCNIDYFPDGPQVNVSIDTLTAGGWTLCHKELYSNNLTDAKVAQIQEMCDGDNIMIGCKPSGTADRLSVAAWGRRKTVFNAGQESGTRWYRTEKAWGFAPANSPIDLTDADVKSGVTRISFHLNMRYGGFRCGERYHLNDSNDWERLFFHTK